MTDENSLSRTFDHVLISAMDQGVELKIGPHAFRLKKKVPAAAIIKLVTNSNNIVGMQDYLRDLIISQEEKDNFDVFIVPDVSADGLGEIIEWVTEVMAAAPLEPASA